MFSKLRTHLLGPALLCATVAAVVSGGGTAPLKDAAQEPGNRANAALDLERSDVQDLSIEDIDPDSFSTTVMIDGEPHVLDMVRHSLRSPNFELKVQYEDGGPLVTVDPPPVRTFQGTVRDLPDSHVRLTYRDTAISGIIMLPDQRVFGIEPLATLDIEAPVNRHVIYDSADWRNSAGYECGVDAKMEQFGFVNPEPDGDRQAAGTGDDIMEIGLDSDANYYNDNGGDVAATLEAMEEIINNVGGVYRVTPINITYEITVAIVRTTNGSYTSSDAGTLLCQFRSEWNSSPENTIQRDVAHLFTGKDLIGSTIGIAWLSRVCNLGGFTCGESGSMAYGVSQDVSGVTARTGLTAHELGHNWSSPHCNSSPNCRIMCSGLGGCDGLSPLTFAPDPESTILNFKNNSNCLTPLGPKQSLPLCEEFANASLDTDRWSYIDGALVSSAASNPPSPPFALQLNAAGSGEYLDDQIRTNFFLLGGELGVELTFYTQHQGVEAGEELVVEYLDLIDRWIELTRVTSDGVDQTDFEFHSITLPVPSAHNNFRLRFRAEVDSTGDNWYVDDVGLDCFCEAPCSDDDACTISDSCVDVQCVGTPVDCSAGNTECAATTCDPAGSEGNCDLLEPVNDGGACNGGDGYCAAGACADGATSGRVFMAADGQQNSVDPGGPTTLVMSAGSTVTVGVFIADNTPVGPSAMNGYQIIVPFEAQPQPGAVGSVAYVDDNPGNSGGGSVFLDTMRTDWIYADEVVTLNEVYTESLIDSFFGVFYATLPGSGVDAATMPGAQYLVEFELTASADAEGEFLLPFNLAPNAPPLAALFNLVGTEYVVDQYQPLRVVIGDGACSTIQDCADLDGNDIRDDNCLWWECAGGQCLSTAVVFGDMAGQFGACPPDGTADGNDRFAALNCFSDTDPDGPGGFTCEDNPPTAFNVDAGGQFGSCNPDGVCDGNDAFAALNAFGGETTCSCPLGGPAPTIEPRVVDRAGLALSTARGAVRPGGVIEVTVELDRPLPDLRGYQLHVAATGGNRGALELIDIAVPDDGVLDSDWTAFNIKTRQMVAGRDAPGTPVRPAALATFTFRASKDAAGRFAVEVLPFDAAHPHHRSFLFPTVSTDMIAIDAGKPLIVEVNPIGKRLRTLR